MRACLLIGWCFVIGVILGNGCAEYQDDDEVSSVEEPQAVGTHIPGSEDCPTSGGQAWFCHSSAWVAPESTNDPNPCTTYRLGVSTTVYQSNGQYVIKYEYTSPSFASATSARLDAEGNVPPVGSLVAGCVESDARGVPAIWNGAGPSKVTDCHRVQ